MFFLRSSPTPVDYRRPPTRELIKLSLSTPPLSARTGPSRTGQTLAAMKRKANRIHPGSFVHQSHIHRHSHNRGRSRPVCSSGALLLGKTLMKRTNYMSEENDHQRTKKTPRESNLFGRDVEDGQCSIPSSLTSAPFSTAANAFPPPPLIGALNKAVCSTLRVERGRTLPVSKT